MQSRVLGLDIQGVIFDRQGAELTEVPGAIESIAGLNMRAGIRIYLVSVALDEAERTEVVGWLKEQHFAERTGIPLEDAYFCSARREKPETCRKLGVTHFVDDRAELVLAVSAVVPHCFLFRPNDDEAQPFAEDLSSKGIPRFETWPALVDAFVNN